MNNNMSDNDILKKQINEALKLLNNSRTLYYPYTSNKDMHFAYDLGFVEGVECVFNNYIGLINGTLKAIIDKYNMRNNR